MAEERVQRRLAAILAADMVGYSRLMEADETGTIARQKVHRSELVDPEITNHGGRIVKTTGDGMLVEFPSVVEATECAVAIQRAMVEREAKVTEDRRIQYRIGINLGDIVIDDDDILGDGVNIAARLEGLAEPSGVCISDVVHQSVAGKLDLAFEDLGEQQVKNITKPVHAYRLILDRAQAAPSGAALSASDKPSIAVLPFDNLSDDPQQEYFSDGMAEDLITDISKISGLFVVARNSSFAFKGQAVDVKEIAKKLGVKHILEGSVRKMGPKLRVNVQLIDAASGGHLWAERYDGDMEDIFQFQDDIREQIVSALQVSLTPTDKALTERKPTDSVEAYDLFLKGRANLYRFTPEDVLEAIKCLEEAIEIDPKFAEPYGYLSHCHFVGFVIAWPGYEDGLDRANELAERGVALDGTSAFALARLAWIQAFLRHHEQAIENLEKAISFAPDSAEVNATCGQVLNYCGTPERGLEMLEKALSLDTFAPPLWEFYAGVSNLLLRQYGEALTRFDRVVGRVSKVNVTAVPASLFMACAYTETDRLNDARKVIKGLLETQPHYSLKEFSKLLPYRVDEDRNRFLDDLRKAGLPEG